MKTNDLSVFHHHVLELAKARGIPFAEVPVGDGALDLGRLVRRMRADGYAGGFVAEHFGRPDQDAAMRRSAAFCRKLLGKRNVAD